MTRLTRDDFALRPERLAQALIGCTLVRALPSGERVGGVIVETEAYLGVKDRAAHAFGGRRTARNESMYHRPGTLYVYFTYGMHHYANVVCGGEGEPVAVLLRALRPTLGLGAMLANRRRHPKSPTTLRDRDLCSGPAKLCQALAIDRGLDREDLDASAVIWIEPRSAPPPALARSPRIGVASAGDWAHRPLRWFLAHDPNVSR